MSDWHFRLQRPQLLMRALAAMGHRCFFLNPHLGRQFPNKRDSSPRMAQIAPNVFELHVPLPREPVYHHRLLHADESRILAETVETLRLIAGARTFLQIVGSPVWGRAAQLTRERSGSPIIYDCHDLISGFASTHASIQNEEAAIIARSDFIVCSSEALLDHCMKMGASPERCGIIRNAATLHAPVPLHVNPNPHIGYLGALEDWLDVESIRQAAIARPDWRFLLAGRVESGRVDELRRLANVELCGEIPSEQVPSFFARLDLATVPFLVNELTRAVDPIKVYEYLGFGLPVVASRLPETFRFAHFLHYYEGPAGFVRAIEDALADRSPERSSIRREAVSGETWEARARELVRFGAVAQAGVSIKIAG